MKTTFLIARNLGISAFEVMSQDLEYVIMIVNFLLDSVSEDKTEDSAQPLSDKEKDKAFWSAL